MKISNRKIHFFNPGHEDAIRTGQHHYTPPSSVCKMISDLAYIPAWYGNEGDYVIINEMNKVFHLLSFLPVCIRPVIFPILPSELTQLNSPIPMEAAPWGLSPHSIHLFKTLLQPYGNMIIPQWKDTYKHLTSRQTALKCLYKIKTLLPETFKFLTLPLFCSTTDEMLRFMTEHPPPYLLKTPYSCSGRGLYRIRENYINHQASRWIEGALKKQGVISIEHELEKVCDFAMEFESNGNGRMLFIGFSVFETLSNGKYRGNLLGSQALLEQHITNYISASLLQEIKEAVIMILTEVISFEYNGYLGVDMLIYRKDNSFSIHPVVEINLRNTMGIVALQLSKRIVHPSSHGQLVITYDKTENGAYMTHLQMQEAYPLQFSDSKILSGYLSLCPVTRETQFIAYVLIQEENRWKSASNFINQSKS